MNKRLLGAGVMLVPLVVGGVVAANSQNDKTAAPLQSAQEFICPMTGDVLPCPNCCPLSKTEAK